MGNLVAVAVVDTKKQLSEALGRLLLCEELLFDDLIEQLTSSAKLGDQVEVLVIFEVLNQLQDMRVIQLLQNRDFSSELLNISHLLARDSLTSSVQLSDSVPALGDHTEPTSTQGLLAHLVDVLDLLVVFLDHGRLVDDDVLILLHFEI